MAAQDLLLDDVLSDCPGCTIALARYAIKRTVIEFYRRSRVRRYTTPAVAVTSVEAATNIAPSDANGLLPTANTMMLELEKAWWLGEPLDVVNKDQVEADLGPDWKDAVGAPRYAVQETLDSLRLVPHLTEDTAAALRLALVYGPSDSSVAIDDDVYARFKLELAAGAKGYLMAMAKKPWTDTAMATVWRKVFRDCTASLSVRAAFGPAGAPRVTTPFFS